MNVDIPRIMQSIGLPELVKISNDQLYTHVIPAAIDAFSDHDLLTPVPHGMTGRSAELYGSDYYGRGELAKRLAAAAAITGTDKSSPIYAMEHAVADVVSDPNSSYFISGANPPVMITPEVLVVDDSIYQHRGEVRSVVEFGACLTSRSYVIDQYAAGMIHHKPFEYRPITRSHYMGRALEATYLRTGYCNYAYQPDQSNPWFKVAETGVARATDELLTEQRTTGQSAGITDVVIANSGVHTSVPELRTGIRRSMKLLRSGGAIVLRGFVRPQMGEVGIDAVLGWANDAGYDTRQVSPQTTQMKRDINTIFRGRMEDRRIESVVLFKD